MWYALITQFSNSNDFECYLVPALFLLNLAPKDIEGILTKLFQLDLPNDKELYLLKKTLLTSYKRFEAGGLLQYMPEWTDGGRQPGEG